MRKTTSRSHRRHAPARFVLLVALVLAAFGAGCGGGATYTTAAEADTLASAGYQVGQHVQVEWRGSWYAATIVAVLDGGQYHIHYDGWGDEWDEAVDALRIRTEGEILAPPTELIEPETGDNTGTTDDPGGYSPPLEQPLQPGLQVHVEWRGSWFRAEVVDAPYNGPEVRVHYLGWDAEWDENVTRDRIRVDGSTQ